MPLVVGLGALTVAGLLVLNVVGLAPLPLGPLGDHQPAVPDIAVDTIDYDPHQIPWYMTALVENTGPVVVTIVRVTPVGTTVPGSVEVLGSLPFSSGDPASVGSDGMPQITLGIQPDPGPAWTSPQPITGVTVEPKGAAQHEGRAFLVRVTPDPILETAVLWFDVEYAIGPVHFVTTAWGPVGTTLVFCGRDRPVASRVGFGCATSGE